MYDSFIEWAKTHGYNTSRYSTDDNRIVFGKSFTRIAWTAFQAGAAHQKFHDSKIQEGEAVKLTYV